MLRETSIYESNNTVEGLPPTKHIFVGTTRIVSKLSHQDLGFIDNEYAKNNTFYIHQDHLGSSNIISDRDGNEYEHLIFTPYGETWAEEGEEQVLAKIKFKFTSKELDDETNLYYFGARYLDAQVSRWMSVDPILSSYLNGIGGMGGVYNPINLNLYHYAANNPIKYIDPNGEENDVNSDAAFEDPNNFPPMVFPVNDLLQQTDKSLNIEDKQMEKSGCNFLSCAALPQKEENKKLNSNKINQLKKFSEETKVSGGRNKNASIINPEDLYVNNSTDIMDKVFNELKSNKSSFRIGRKKENNEPAFKSGYKNITPDYMISTYSTLNEPYYKHTVLEDGSGNLLYNPDTRIDVSNSPLISSDLYIVNP